LYYYKGSQDEEPTGIISLKHAQIRLSKSYCKISKYVLKVKTVFRTLHLKAKHEAAMQSWLSALDHARANHTTEGGNDSSSTLTSYLEKYRVKREWKKLKDFFEDRTGRKYFKKFLNKEGELALFKFYRDSNDFQKLADGTGSNLSSKAESIYERYIEKGGERSVQIFQEIRDSIKSNMKSASNSGDWSDVFSVANEMAKLSLQNEWIKKFKKTQYFDDLKRQTQSPEEIAEPIPGPKILVIWYEASKVTHELKQGFTKVGRDDSCDIVLSDPRSSREHCIFEVNANDQVILKDLGSSRGTKVNGTRIIKHGMKLTDEIKVGTTVMRIDSKRGK